MNKLSLLLNKFSFLDQKISGALCLIADYFSYFFVDNLGLEGKKIRKK